MNIYRIAAVYVATLILPHDVSSQEWTRFRGPNGSGISDSTTVPTKWDDKDLNWKTELLGRGQSSPVIWGDRIFVTSCDEDASTRYLQCIRVSDGTVLWNRDFPFEIYTKHKNNSYASSTPCVDAEFVYVVWQSKKASSLLAINHAGETAWTYDLGPYRHGQGGASSPILYDDAVVFANDQKQPSFLLAVDRKNGEELWKIPRDGKRACYATPCILHAKNQPAEIIFSHCFEGIIGVDAKSGTPKWHTDVFGRLPQRALSSPIVSGEFVFATSGAAGGERQLVAIRPNRREDEVSIDEIYRSNRQVPHVPTPLIYEDWLFLWNDNGIVSCLDSKTGKPIWTKRVGGNFFGSPICIDGKLYCVDRDGNVIVLAASDQYQLIARNSLGYPSKATPAVSDGTLFIRTESHLFSIGGG